MPIHEDIQAYNAAQSAGDKRICDALAKAKQDAEQTIDTVTVDTVLSQGFDAAAKAKAAGLVQAFRDYMMAPMKRVEKPQEVVSQNCRVLLWSTNWISKALAKLVPK